MEKEVNVKTEHIYLISDDIMYRRPLQLYLESEDFNCHTFSSCEKFLGVYNSQLRGCIVLDHNNFDIDGVALLEKIKQDQSRLKTIILSDHETVSHTVGVMKLGVFDRIQKPFSGNELCSSIRTALSANNNSRENESRDS